MSEYAKSRERLKIEEDNVGMIDEVYKYFKENKIKIIKINHCFAESGST